MRSYLPAFELRTPSGLGEALDMLAHEPGVWRPFAGGTDLMVLLEAGKLEHRRYVNLWPLAEMRGIEAAASEVVVGALTTYAEIQRHPVLQGEFPMLCQAARETGGVAIQNRGTLGGNIMNASPAADSCPALLAYDAELELVSRRGARRLPYAVFHTGYKRMALAADELLKAIHLPRTEGWRDYYRKVGTRRAQAIAKVCFAGRARVENSRLAGVRVALGSVAPTVIRCPKTEQALVEGRGLAAAQAALASEIAPIDDMRSSARYRRRVCVNLLEEFLASVTAV
jgi:CO/xanthine dehydrogenase FAD-binding subunit